MVIILDLDLQAYTHRALADCHSHSQHVLPLDTDPIFQISLLRIKMLIRIRQHHIQAKILQF